MAKPKPQKKSADTAEKRTKRGRKAKRQKAYGTGYVMQAMLHTKEAPLVRKPVGETLVRGLQIIRNMQMTSSTDSDPFRWDRLRTHFKAGLVDFHHLAA